jgi:hypothetical protein
MANRANEKISHFLAKYIAKWNGSSWSALGTGLNASVTTLAVIANDLYVSGGFATAGGISVNRIAKWDGSSWSELGRGLLLNSAIAIHRHGGERF